MLETPENEGYEGQKRTKMPILCSGRGEFALGSVRVTFLAEMQLAVRTAAQKHREEASGKHVPGYVCLGGALRGYILSITSIGTPRILCSCLFVAE